MELDFSLFTTDELNTAMLKVKEARMKTCDTNPVEYQKLLQLTHKLEDEIRVRAKAQPISHEEFVSLCGM